MCLLKKSLPLKILLTHYCPMFSFYTPWKHQKTYSFLKFSEGIRREHWVVMAISENRAFHPKSVETIFSTCFVSTHGWNSLNVAEKIVLLFEKD